MQDTPQPWSLHHALGIADGGIADAELNFDCDCAVMAHNAAYLDVTLPVIYALELTPACNNRCFGCSNAFSSIQHGRAEGYAPLSAERWGHVLDTIVPYAQRVMLTGGEPTCHPQFDAIVEATARRGMTFTLFTNGRWGNLHNPQRIRMLLQESGVCAGLLVSLHGADARAHDAFTGVVGSFAETVESIAQARHAGLAVYTNTVLTGHNKHQLASIVQLSQSLGCGCAVFNRYVGPLIDDAFRLPLSDIAQAVAEIEQLRATGACIRLGTCIPACFVPSSSTGCLAGTASCTIDPWGYVRPCNHAPHVAGHILHDSLQTIWHSPTMRHWRGMIPAACQSCSLFASCGGGCRADAVLKGVEEDPLIQNIQDATHIVQ